MSRKARYSKELKLEIVKRYLNGESPTSLANEYGLSTGGKVRIWKWSNKYRTLGEIAFEETPANKSYSKEFKIKVIKEYLSGLNSYVGLANKYNISSDEIVRQWVLKYNNGIEITDYNPKGDVYTMKSRKTTFEERIEIVKYVLANDLDYKGASDKYSIPYASVYKWVKKYNDIGEDGLKDSRGRPSSCKTNKELTIEEKQTIEIERLKKELERQKMINEVLKKNVEIRKRMEKNSHLLDKKINTKQ